MLDSQGNPVVKRDEDGNECVDVDGNPVYEEDEDAPSEYTLVT